MGKDIVKLALESLFTIVLLPVIMGVYYAMDTTNFSASALLAIGVIEFIIILGVARKLYNDWTNK